MQDVSKTPWDALARTLDKPRPARATTCFPASKERPMPRALTVFLFCLTLTACMPSIPFVGDGDDVVTAADQSYTMHLAPNWSASGKSAKAGENGQGAARVVVHADSAQSPQGYPTLVVREVRDPTPLGLFELMAKDKLEFSELWSVSKDKYTLQDVQVDPKGQVLTYWLVPVDGRGVEYFGASYLTSWGRLELVGLAQAGTARKYAKDFSQMFSSVRLDDKAVPKGTKPGDLGRYLARTYAKAIGSERQALSRLASDIASYASSGAALDPQQKGMLQITFAKAASGCQEAAAALESQLTQQAATGRGADQASTWQAQTDRLDAQTMAIETVVLNLRDKTAIALAEKAQVRAKRLVTLAREAGKLPM